MAFRSFSLRIGLRVALLTVVLVALLYSLLQPGYPTLSLLLTLLAMLQLSEIMRFVSLTNAELSRFLDAVRYDDFGQRFDMHRLGSGFEDLGEVFTDIVTSFQEQRADQEAQLRHLRALTEHVPVPLLSLHQDGEVALHNNAARRLFGSVKIQRDTDLAQFGDEFLEQLAAIRPGERRMVLFNTDGLEQRLVVSATEVVVAGKLEKLISLQNIQSELDGVQLQAWQDLVRVLTHEIMNSITPVASLARTATDLVDDAAGKLQDQPEVMEDLADVKSAVDTVARRSDGLMQFVQSYRRLTRLPPPKLQPLVLGELFASLEQLVAKEWQDRGLTLEVAVTPSSLEVEADRDMLEQVLLNLLQNSEQALTENTDRSIDEPPTMRLHAYLNRHGHVCIEVSDNGPGIAEDIAGRIFVPFFTTRREGSGVGLALTRQVMLAHGGSVVLGQSDSGGARFTLTF